LTAIAGGGVAGGSRPWRTQQRTQDMTRTIIRISPSQLYLAYVVLKDPETRLCDAKPVFPHCGALLIGVESVDFFDHLRELVGHEDPELAEDIDVVSTVLLTPAAKVRLKSELEHTQRAVHALLHTAEPTEADSRVAQAVMHLSRLADSLRLEVNVGTLQEERERFLQQRNALILSRCWSIVRDIAMIELRSRLYSVPHALSSLLSSVRVWMQDCTSSVEHVPDSAEAMSALETVFDFLHAGHPLQKSDSAEALNHCVQKFQFFIDRAIAVIGTNDHLLSPRDLAFFASAEQDVEAYSAPRRLKARDSAPVAPIVPTRAASVSRVGSSGGASRTDSAPASVASGETATLPNESTPIAPTPPPTESAPEPTIKWRRVCSRLAFDDEGGKLMLDGVVHDFQGNTTKQYLLMMVISRRLNHWNGPDVLEGRDSPWFGGTCTMHALGSCASKIRTSLRAREMHDLADAIETRKFRQSPQAKLAWPPPARNVT